jgi:hypothetical protein
MSSIVIWALLNGLLTGGVGVGIVLLRRQRRMARQEPALLDELMRRLDELDAVHRRLAEIEERLDFTDRMLSQQRDTAQLPPSGIQPT